jgi:hypothetical protein
MSLADSATTQSQDAVMQLAEGAEIAITEFTIDVTYLISFLSQTGSTTAISMIPQRHQALWQYVLHCASNNNVHQARIQLDMLFPDERTGNAEFNAEEC